MKEKKIEVNFLEILLIYNKYKGRGGKNKKIQYNLIINIKLFYFILFRNIKK